MGKIYWFSWKCFQAADADRDGQVSAEEFGTMINVATAAQKRLGLPSPYQTAEEQAVSSRRWMTMVTLPSPMTSGSPASSRKSLDLLLPKTRRQNSELHSSCFFV